MTEKSLTGDEIDKLLEGGEILLVQDNEGPLGMGTIRNKVVSDKGLV
jgi:hypothetical protein